MKIIHIMKDGSVRDSVKDLKVSYKLNETVYKIIDSINKGVNYESNSKNFAR